MTNKIDLRKELKYLYAPSAKNVELVDVPAFKYVMVDGTVPAGVPVADAPEFAEAMTAMYGMSYTLKFASKLRKENPIDYTVMALEALWWVEGGEFEFGRKQDWRFTALMMQPDHITTEMYQQALEQLKKKKPSQGLAKLRFETFHEGLSVQVMHIGPYSAEQPTIERMKAFMKENGLVRNGHHHEIYFGDPRRSAPEKLKTILRQPVKKA